MAASACKTSVIGVSPNDTTTKPVTPKTAMTADRDSIPWTADPTNSSKLNDSITIYGKGTTHGAPADTLIFKIKYTSPGTYVLTKDQASYRTVKLVDTVSNIHKLDSLYSNSINITYDMATNRASGTFNVKFIDSAAKDISFLNGKFNTPLK